MPIACTLRKSLWTRSSRYTKGPESGREEIYAEFLDTSDGGWFARSRPSEHVSLSAEHHPAYETFLAIDCGISQHVGAVFFQVEQLSTSTVIALLFLASTCAKEGIRPRTRQRSSKSPWNCRAVVDLAGFGLTPLRLLTAALARSLMASLKKKCSVVGS